MHRQAGSALLKQVVPRASNSFLAVPPGYHTDGADPGDSAALRDGRAPAPRAPVQGWAVEHLKEQQVPKVARGTAHPISTMSKARAGVPGERKPRAVSDTAYYQFLQSDGERGADKQRSVRDATFNIERAEGRGRVDAGRIPDWSWTVNGKPLSSQPHYTAYAMHEGEILLLALKPDCPVPATFQIRVTDRNGFEGSAEATARVLPRLLLTPAEATVISGNGRPFWVRRGDGQRYTRCEAEVLEPGGGSMALSEDGHWRYHAPMVQSPTWFTLQIRDRDRPELTAQARVKVLPAFTSIQDMDPD